MTAMARICSAALVIAAIFVTGSLSLVDGTSEEHRLENINSSSVVTVVVGSNAYLQCHLPNSDVSGVVWLRHLDTHNVVIEHQGPNERFLLAGKFLLIDAAQIEDSGVYVCFVTRAPGDIHWVLLSIVEPKIVGEPTRSVLDGDSVNLTCVIDPNPSSEVNIEWARDAGDGIIHLHNDSRITTVLERGTALRSTLLINSIQVAEAGNYTCTPSEGNRTATAAVHVAQRLSENPSSQ